MIMPCLVLTCLIVNGAVQFNKIPEKNYSKCYKGNLKMKQIILQHSRIQRCSIPHCLVLTGYLTRLLHVK